MQARSPAILALLGVFLSPAAAGAAGPLRLSVARSADAVDCPDTAALREKIDALLRPGALDSGALLVDAQFFQEQRRYTVTLRISGERPGVRTLSDPGPTCAGLAEATALTLAMLLDPELAAPPASSPPPAAPPASSPSPSPPAPRPVVEVSVGALLTAGLTASPAAGVQGGVGLAWPSWSATLGAAWLPARTFELAPGSLAVSLQAAWVRGCRRLRAGALTAGGCLRLGAGRYQAEARGYARNLSPEDGWAGAGGSGMLGGALAGPLGWEAELGWVASWRRRAFLIDGVGKAFDPSPWGGPWGSLSLVLRLLRSFSLALLPLPRAPCSPPPALGATWAGHSRYPAPTSWSRPPRTSCATAPRRMTPPAARISTAPSRLRAASGSSPSPGSSSPGERPRGSSWRAR